MNTGGSGSSFRLDRALAPTIPHWVERVTRIDPVGPVILAHSVVLRFLNPTLHPRSVVTVAAVLFLVRASTTWRASAGTSFQARLLLSVRGLGSIGLAYLVIGLDGGTESPYFFWPLLILAWEAITQPLGRFRWLLVGTVASHVGLVTAVGEFTAAGITRIGLIVAFWSALAVGRRYLSAQHQQLQRYTELLNAAFDALPLGIVVSVLESPSTLYANPMAESMGVSDLTAIRVRPWPDTEADSRSLIEVVTSDPAYGDPTGTPLLVAVDDEHPPRFLRAAPIRYSHIAQGHEDGTQLIVVAIEDVTAQVTAGEERRRFLEEASHQLRTPLTPIIGYAHLLADGVLAADQITQTAEDMLAAAERLDRLFERMKTVTRLQQPDPLVLENVTIPTLLERHLERLDPDLSRIVHTAGDPEIKVRCHPPYVARALHELLDNSRRFGAPPITLTWQETEDYVRLEVTDAGSGPLPDLPPEDVLPFAAWTSTRPRDLMAVDTGTRLGLYLAASLTTASHGTLSFHRQPDHWAFILHLDKPSASV